MGCTSIYIVFYIAIIGLFLFNFMTKTQSFLQVGTVNATLFYNTEKFKFNWILYVLFGIIYCVIIIRFITYNYKTKFMSYVLLVIFWIICFVNVLEKNLIVNQTYAFKFKEIAEVMEEKDTSIYYVYDDVDFSHNRLIEIIQFLLPNDKIQIIPQNQVTDKVGFIIYPKGLLDTDNNLIEINDFVLTIFKR